MKAINGTNACEQIAVIGAGTMGCSIAVAFARAGFGVLLKDMDEAILAAGMQRIEKLIASLTQKGLLSTEADALLKSIKPITDFNELSNADFVIEAVTEQIDVKKIVFKELEKHCRTNTIFASNTSSLSITQLGACIDNPERVVGMHFFNPAHLMKLVEVVPGVLTSDVTIKKTLVLAEKLGKFAVQVQECPSFLVNRLLSRYMNEAMWCLQEGIASVEEIDMAACNYVMPVGPLALRDANGADVGLAVAKFNYQEYGERFCYPELLSLMVEEELLGKKSLAGFYSYDSVTGKKDAPNKKVEELIKRVVNKASTKLNFSAERLFLPMINEAFLALQEKIVRLEDLDPALKNGLGMRKGPLQLAQEMGLNNCLEALETHFKAYGERFRPAPLLKRLVWARLNEIILR